MGDHHPSLTTDRSDETDAAFGHRADRLTANGSELEPTIASTAERVARGTERVDDRRVDGAEPQTLTHFVRRPHLARDGRVTKGRESVEDEEDGEQTMANLRNGGDRKRARLAYEFGGRMLWGRLLQRLEGGRQADSRSIELRRDFSCITALV